MVGRFKTIPKETIKQRSEDMPLNPESESYIRNKLIEPSKTDYTKKEYDELNYRDAKISNIPKETFNLYLKLFRWRQLEASHWLGMGGSYTELAELCNVENKFDMGVLSSRDGWLGGHLLAPPQRATIKQLKREEGKPGAISRMVSQKEDEFGGME